MRFIASIDALTNRTTYAYDAMGRVVAVTNALGDAIVYGYDTRGNKTYEGGATYPVRYTYDEYGNRTTMTTYRDESAAGDTTTWLYDEPTGLVTNKLYADGKGPSYTYTDDGKLATRTWARGIVTTYAYDGWGNLTNTTYSDETPSVALSYDALGRQTSAIDAAGTTTFLYDRYGQLTNETVVGVAGTNTIARFYDTYGRDAGYALNGERQTSLAYDPATGRLATMQVFADGSNDDCSASSLQPSSSFTWSYHDGSDLKQSLAYPNGLTASWTYDANNQLLQVRNAFPTNIISQFDYTYDAAGRRVSCAKFGSAFTSSDTHSYLYNIRSELTNATASADTAYRYGYQYDPIGNRESSSERGTNTTYTANELNQYTNIEYSAVQPSTSNLQPIYDADGNQTLVKTATGIWSVTYNGENRPIRWELVNANSNTSNSNTQTLLTMTYDRMGRRVEFIEIVGSVTNKHQKFVYDGYLCIQRLNGSNNSITELFEWDPTEKVATRPLYWQSRTVDGNFSLFYTHDGNKNVSEVVHFSRANGVAAHYEYAPFGEVAAQVRQGGVAAYDFAALNPWRFSSEYADDALGCDYYNYREYEPVTGRWMSRDPIGESGSMDAYSFCGNFPFFFDMLGLKLSIYGTKEQQSVIFKLLENIFGVGNVVLKGNDVVWVGSGEEIGCECIKLLENDPTYSIMYQSEAELYGGGMFAPERYGGVYGGNIGLGEKQEYSRGNELSVDSKFPFIHFKEKIDTIDEVLAHELAHAVLHQRRTKNADKRLPSGSKDKQKVEAEAKSLTDFVRKGCRK